MVEALSVDSMLEKALEGSNAEGRSDAIVVALHASLLAEGFQLTAVGDEDFNSGKTPKDNTPLSTPLNPVLPRGWNSAQDVYTLQYKQQFHKNRICLIKAIPLGDQLLISTLASDDLDDVHTFSIPLDQFIKMTEQTQKLSVAVFKNIIQSFSILNKEIVSKIKISVVKEKPTVKQQKQQQQQQQQQQWEKDSSESDSEDKDIDALSTSPLRVPNPQHPVQFIHPIHVDSNPFVFGSGDLSPFGGQGGMIMDPLRQGGGRLGRSMGPRLPGSHPPGARFDPISPFEPRFHPGRGGERFGIGGRGGGRMTYDPDPDHLPPPGYDDMFS